LSPKPQGETGKAKETGRFPSPLGIRGSIADLNAAHYSFSPRGDLDASLNIAVGLVGRGRDNESPSEISVMVMMVVFKEPMVVMVMMVIVILCEL
jgi:hypothetical protein